MDSMRKEAGSKPPRRLLSEFRKQKPKAAVILEPNVALRSALRRFLHSYSIAEVIGEASETEDSLALIQEQRPEFVFTDFCGSDLDGLLVCQSARAQSPRPKVFIFTDFSHASTYHNRIHRAGASALILRNASPFHWLCAVGRLARAEFDEEESSFFIDSDIGGLLRQQQQLVADYQFSLTELGVLIRLRMPPRQIAEELDITTKVVWNLQANIHEAFNVKSNAAAIAKAESVGYSILPAPGVLNAWDESQELERSTEALLLAARFSDD
ncbi:MAG: response regulator [Candidatus Obscuribacterales bacterium]|nr:response regulator [Candidatus Obscuribacterales bacterium]